MCRIFASCYSSHSLQGRGGGEGRGLIPKHPVIHGPSRDHFGTYSDTVEFMAEAMNVSRYMVWNGCYPLGLVVYIEKRRRCPWPKTRGRDLVSLNSVPYGAKLETGNLERRAPVVGPKTRQPTAQ